MGQSNSQLPPSTHLTSSQQIVECPVQNQHLTECPVKHQSAECPVKHDFNQANQMPELSQLPSPSQSIKLSIGRTISSIPRPATEPRSPITHWQYPSPQQFYNALLRKGWETPEEHVETMVDIHNFLNEKAWEEVLNWERRRVGASRDDRPQLAHFMGRPGELSPKARIHLLAGWLLPSKFSSEPPFDRHDWVIHRPNTKENVRYVIDYYSAPPEADGSPVFSLDVRPALDNWESARDRFNAATEDFVNSWKEDRSSSKTIPEKRP